MITIVLCLSIVSSSGTNAYPLHLILSHFLQITFPLDSPLELPTADDELSSLTGDLMSEDAADGDEGATQRLFRRPEQEGTYEKLDSLLRQMREGDDDDDGDDDYVGNFAESMKQEMLLVGTMSVDAIQVKIEK